MKVSAIAVVLVAMSSLSALAQQMPSFDDRPKINVTGEAVVEVKPDRIVLTLGIETWDKDIDLAKQKNNEILKKAVTVIRNCGIPNKEIHTDELSIHPRYHSDWDKKEFIGFFVQNTFFVTLNETSKVEELVSKLLKAGVTDILGIDFQTTEFKKYREQARELALKAAKEKAEKMAAVLGQSIGPPLQISENNIGMASRYYSSWFWRGWNSNQMGMTQNVIQNMQGDSSQVSDTIALGKISIRAAVGVTFLLK